MLFNNGTLSLRVVHAHLANFSNLIEYSGNQMADSALLKTRLLPQPLTANCQCPFKPVNRSVREWSCLQPNPKTRSSAAAGGAQSTQDEMMLRSDLTAVILDDQLLIERNVNIFARWRFCNGPTHLTRVQC